MQSLSCALLLACLATGQALSIGTLRAPARPALRHLQCVMEAEAPAQGPPQGPPPTENDYEEEAAPQAAPVGTGAPSAGAKKVINNMRSESGVEFAPWMKIDAEAVARAERERKARIERAANANRELDQLAMDPQAAELGAGGGLKSKVISEDEVELRWSTGDETGNEGFIVQRRQGGTERFEVIADYTSFAPLRTKGATGGDYTYLDDSVPSTGTWVYRIVDCSVDGDRQAVCQKLVEVDSVEETKATIFIGVAILGLALVLTAVGTFIDPIQTTQAGRGFGGF